MTETTIHLKKCPKCKKDSVVVREDDWLGKFSYVTVYYAEDGVLRPGPTNKCPYCGYEYEE